MAEKFTIILNNDQATIIRRALRIGLTCFGEIEQRRNAIALYEVTGKKLPDDLRVLHPTGTSNVVSDFAAALSYLG